MTIDTRPVVERRKTRLVPQPTPKVIERNARLIALLNSFEEGDAEQQRQDLASLQIGIDEARPGQRRVSGEGFNP